MIEKNSAARPTSATWTAAITLSAPKIVRMTTIGRGAARRRKRPVASATAMTTANTPSDGAGSHGLDRRAARGPAPPRRGSGRARGRARRRAPTPPAIASAGGSGSEVEHERERAAHRHADERAEREDRAVAAPARRPGAERRPASRPSAPPSGQFVPRPSTGRQSTGMARAGAGHGELGQARLDLGRERLPGARGVERERDRGLVRVHAPGARAAPAIAAARLLAAGAPRTASCVCTYQLPGSRARGAPERAARAAATSPRVERERAGDDVGAVAQRVQLPCALEAAAARRPGRAPTSRTARSISRAASAGQRVGRRRDAARCRRSAAPRPRAGAPPARAALLAARRRGRGRPSPARRARAAPTASRSSRARARRRPTRAPRRSPGRAVDRRTVAHAPTKKRGEQRRRRRAGLPERPPLDAVRVERLLPAAPLARVVVGEVVGAGALQRMRGELAPGDAPEVVAARARAAGEARARPRPPTAAPDARRRPAPATSTSATPAPRPRA